MFRAGVKVAHDLGCATDLLDDHVALALLDDALTAEHWATVRGGRLSLWAFGGARVV